MINDVQELIKAIERAHGCKSVHLGSVSVTEAFKGQTVWDGVVEEFSIAHPKATRCYGWTVPSGEGKDKDRYVVILGIPPATSPIKAVQTFIAADFHKGKSK